MIAANPPAHVVADALGARLATDPHVLYPPSRVVCTMRDARSFECRAHSHAERVGKPAHWQDTVTLYRVIVRDRRIVNVHETGAIA